MKAFPLNCSDHLSELTTEIKTAIPERASEIIHRATYLFVFAGYGDAAYEVLPYLLHGELQLNPYLNYAVRNYNSLVLNLCNALAINSPALSTQSAMSVDELSKFINQQDRDKRSTFLFEKLLGVHLSPEMESCIKSQSSNQTRERLIKWWRTEDRSFHSMNKLIVCRPIMRSLLSGLEF